MTRQWTRGPRASYARRTGPVIDGDSSVYVAIINYHVGQPTLRHIKEHGAGAVTLDAHRGSTQRVRDRPEIVVVVVSAGNQAPFLICTSSASSS